MIAFCSSSFVSHFPVFSAAWLMLLLLAIPILSLLEGSNARYHIDRPIVAMTLFLHYVLVIHYWFCCLLVACLFPIYNYLACSRHHYLFYRLNVLGLVPGPCLKGNLCKTLASVYKLLSHARRMLDILGYSYCSNGFLFYPKLSILLIHCLRVLWSVSINYPSLDSHNFLYYHSASIPCSLLRLYRRYKHIPNNFVCLFDHDTLQRSIWNRLFQLNPLTSAYLKILAVSRYEKPVDFNRVERAFLL